MAAPAIRRRGALCGQVVALANTAPKRVLPGYSVRQEDLHVPLPTPTLLFRFIRFPC